ncbi:hypothetical protein SLEP1_g2485 [Rubroshorea leprosula]|uniref:Uncharacterized protein n=1 Tax=Rubroshorea leprosula TaxID=152421 RepID=A0AAV5HQM9_9ROSI|nr:hypothetical protein SLEP1_g2485 [Rubroshorea leprosula]
MKQKHLFLLLLSTSYYPRRASDAPGEAKLSTYGIIANLPRPWTSIFVTIASLGL